MKSRTWRLIFSTWLKRWNKDRSPWKNNTQSEHELRLLAEILRDTAAALNSTLDYEIVLERILTNIGLVIPHDFTNIMLIDPEQNIVRVVAEYGYAEHGLQQWIERTTFTMDELKTLARMYHTSTPILITNTTNNPMWVVYQDQHGKVLHGLPFAYVDR